MSEELQSFKQQRQIRQQGAGNREKGEKEESRAKMEQGKGAGGGKGPVRCPTALAAFSRKVGPSGQHPGPHDPASGPSSASHKVSSTPDS